MISTNAYNYINVLDKAADASWLRETVLSHNIANVDTPGYKRREVDFETLLAQSLKSYKYQALDSKIANTNGNLSRLNAQAHYDYAALGYSYRIDGNNVDIQTENVELASEQLRYTALTNSLTQEFSRLSTAIG